VCRGAGAGGAASALPLAARLLPASVASRYALGADGVGAARPGACGEADRRLSRLRTRRSALGAEAAALCARRSAPRPLPR
jgi:hypothetical protein